MPFTFTLLQTATPSQNVSGDMGAVFSSPVTDGSLVIVVVSGNVGASGLTDSGGGTAYNKIADAASDGGGQVWWGNGVGGITTIRGNNLTYPGVANVTEYDVFAYEFSSINGSNVDKSSSAAWTDQSNTPPNDPIFSGTQSLTFANDLVFVFASGQDVPSFPFEFGPTFAGASGYTFLHNASYTIGLSSVLANIAQGWAYKVLSGTTSVNPELLVGTHTPPDNGSAGTVYGFTFFPAGCIVTPAGVSMTVVENNPTLSTGATVSPTGVSIVSAEHSPTISAEVNVPVVGVSITAVENNPTPSAGVTVEPAGVTMKTAVNPHSSGGNNNRLMLEGVGT